MAIAKLSSRRVLKRNAMRRPEAVRDGLVNEAKGKTSQSRKRVRTLVPVPDGVSLVLDLVNLLPVEFRHPYWARPPVKPSSKSDRYQQYILDWVQGGGGWEDTFSDEWQGWHEGTYELLFYRMRFVLKELPLALQAFILRDEQGRLVQMEESSERVASGLESSLQARRNYELLNKDEADLREVVEQALQRIDRGFLQTDKKEQTRTTYSDALYGKPGDEFKFVSADQLLERARQRFIFVLASQEFVSCLTHPNSEYELFFRHISRVSDATQCTPYVVSNGPKKGTIALGPAPLYNFFVGVEAARIRGCPICSKFFWAGRKDMIGCSTKCSNAHRMRKYRKPNY